MTKIAVFDRTNKNRLLGHLEVRDQIRGYKFSLALMDDICTRDFYLSDIPNALHRFREATFDVEVRQTHTRRPVDRFTTEILTVERKVLETEATLEDLMKIQMFTLPGESRNEAEYRRHRFR